ncbi:TPA: ParB N-terminal domain-containing protein [Pseudomonas aeruginosa]|nr:ParB N-terminal domain-containing protein [Pseudomonas aeruginosa]
MRIFGEPFCNRNLIDVWCNPKTGRLEIQDGHHRAEAAKKAGSDKMAVNIFR